MPKEYFKLYPSRANQRTEKNWQKTEVSNSANYTQITTGATQTYDLYKRLYSNEMSPDRTIQKGQILKNILVPAKLPKRLLHVDGSRAGLSPYCYPWVILTIGRVLYLAI